MNLVNPTIGRIVLYTLSAEDAVKVNNRRTNSASISERVNADEWPIGAQAHIGTEVKEGDTFPSMVVRYVDGMPGVNIKVFLDGNDELHVQNAIEGALGDKGKWAWPVRS